jgi:hypothetical protein
MLRGHFKIGSHQGYSDVENTGLLSDDSEGVGATHVVGDIQNFSSSIGGLIFQNLNVSECGVAIVLNETFNSLMFCSSQGEYDRERHIRIMAGDPTVNLKPNLDLTAHLQLDVCKLILALKAAAGEEFKLKTEWVAKQVIYGDRVQTVPSNNFRGVSGMEMMFRNVQQAFFKPERHRCEDELRFVMNPIAGVDIPKAIYTEFMPDRIHELFKAAIVNKGSDEI